MIVGDRLTHILYRKYEEISPAFRVFQRKDFVKHIGEWSNKLNHRILHSLLRCRSFLEYPRYVFLKNSNIYRKYSLPVYFEYSIICNPFVLEFSTYIASNFRVLQPLHVSSIFKYRIDISNPFVLSLYKYIVSIRIKVTFLPSCFLSFVSIVFRFHLNLCQKLFET